MINKFNLKFIRLFWCRDTIECCIMWAHAISASSCVVQVCVCVSYPYYRVFPFVLKHIKYQHQYQLCAFAFIFWLNCYSIKLYQRYIVTVPLILFKFLRTKAHTKCLANAMRFFCCFLFFLYSETVLCYHATVLH